MKELTPFSEVPLNGNFIIPYHESETGERILCNKIDDARYIEVGKNGAYCLKRNTLVVKEG
jgi:hypothetical protein